MIFLGIGLCYVLMMWLDYLSQQTQIECVIASDKSAIAESYVIRNKFALASRMCSFFIGPLLGVVIASSQAQNLISLFLICSAAAASVVLITTIRFFYLHQGIAISSVVSRLISIQSFMSVLCFTTYLNAPFVVNIVAWGYPTQALWVLQLAPLLTAITSIYIVFFYDPRLAREIDEGDESNEPLFALLLERSLARLSAPVLILAAVQLL